MAMIARRRAIRRAAGTLAALFALCGAFADTPDARIAALVASGNVPAAAQAACEWAAQEPGSLEALRTCGELALRAGMNQAAEDALRSLLFFAPNDPDALLLLGQALIASGDYPGAREQFQRVVQLEADAPAAYVGLARATLTDPDAARDVVSAAEIALTVAPDYAPAHAVMGAALRETGDLDGALAALERAIEIDPDCAPAHFDLGLTRAMVGDEEGARESWRRYLELEPWSDRAWLLRAGLVITGVRELVDRAFDACYSPDGTRIAFRGRGPGGWGVYVIPAEGEPTETLLWATEDNMQSIAWRPDGAAILALVAAQQTVTVRGQERQQYMRRLMLVPADGEGEVTQLLEDQYLGEAAWMPSGHIGMRSYVQRQGWAIVDFDPATGATTPITGANPRLLHLSPAWSADGTRMLAVRRSEERPDGTFAFDLLAGPADDFASACILHSGEDQPRGPTFTPDGSVVVFSLPGTEPGRFSAWASPADGSRDPVLVDHLVGQTVAPRLSPDGRFMLSARGTMLVRLTLDGVRYE